jgi:hypothetical protein
MGPASRGAFFCRAVLRRPEPTLCDSPRGSLFPCSWTLGRARGTRVPRPQLIETPSPRSGSPCVSGKSVTPADIFKWAPPRCPYMRILSIRGIRLWPETPDIPRRPPAFGNRRGAAPAPCVPRQWCVRTPWPALPPTTKPQHCCLPDVGTFGAANRIMFRNRVLGVIARIYQATSRILPRFTISRRRPVGGNHLSVAAPRPRIGSFPPGYEGVRQLPAYLILPFSLFSCSAALICPICVYIHRTSCKE